MTRTATLVALAALVVACGGDELPSNPQRELVGEEREPPAEAPERAGGTEWIFEGSEDERYERIARQLRGFDVAMVEVGYRYTELCAAGADRNWGYADYQLEKIRTAIANGLERRPARAASARMIDGPLDSVAQAIAIRDASALEASLDALTASCNACHVAERVPFVHVVRPTARLSPVRVPAADPAAAPPSR